MRAFVRPVLTGLLATIAAAPAAAADRFDRVIAFGDSYADTGNARAILTARGLGFAFDSRTYPTGRFSGGTNFVDALASTYGVAQDNYAVGGARAGAGNIATDGLIPGLLPGFQQQWQAFVSGGATFRNATAVTIPGGGLTFASNDLGAFSVGGNDARGYRISGGSVAGADAAASAAAVQATQGIDALVGRGLRHMVFIVGDVGQLAEALGTPSAAAGTAFSTSYNSRMQASLSPIAASGVQVAYVDITAIGDVIRANPARFGFTNITQACPQACIGNTALQNQYLFYTDGTHLTSAGFALVGAYAANQLDAPYALRATGDLPRLAAAGFGQSMNARLDLARGRADRQGLALYGQFTADHRRRDADAGGNGYGYTAHGGVGGIEYGMGPATFGAMLSYAKGHAGDANDDRTRADSYQAGGYAVVDDGALFTQAYGGYGWHRVDVRRTGVADPLTASPHARSWTAGLRIGYLRPMGPVRIGPVAGIDYVRARLDGYAETGDEAASLTIGRQKSRTLAGTAGVEARATVLERYVPWLRVAAEKDFQGDGRTVRYAPTVAPTIVNGFEIGDGSRRVYGAVTGGLTAAVAGPVSIDLDGRATFARDQGNDVAGLIGLRLRL